MIYRLSGLALGSVFPALALAGCQGSHPDPRQGPHASMRPAYRVLGPEHFRCA